MGHSPLYKLGAQRARGSSNGSAATTDVRQHMQWDIYRLPNVSLTVLPHSLTTFKANTMPRETERQALSRLLLDMVVMQRMRESAEVLEDEIEGIDTDSESSSSSSEDEPFSSILMGWISHLFSCRYVNQQVPIKKSSEQMYLTLNVWKQERPEIFRRLLRLSPATFDLLQEALEESVIFQSNSPVDNNKQIPLDQQLAIALYKFGHYGNGASTLNVTLWAGVGYGTVSICVRRVIAAVCSSTFRRAAIRWPTDEEKEDAKAWVEATSCPAWRDGWVMVDGTLVPLFARPSFFGTSFFDRKSNYSLNVQLITTPNLRIIDYGIGLPGSQHDATAWKKTRIPKEHATLLPGREWVWGDSAYPLQTWLMAPYKSPEKDEEHNARFNYHVSAVRIRSEHAVGYLKGRFPSLRGLRLRIDNKKHVQFVTFWIIACMAIHNFAMQHEHIADFTLDSFFQEGLRIVSEDQPTDEERVATDTASSERERVRIDERDIELLRARIKREEIKGQLFDYLDSD
ncbi:hypothetical protein NMY22_g19418 [Coprinellus aureogranulatus]|nr:hypothetical protein NMY22_g19418 [Coprinellus aureogranulatus]